MYLLANTWYSEVILLTKCISEIKKTIITLFQSSCTKQSTTTWLNHYLNKSLDVHTLIKNISSSPKFQNFFDIKYAQPLKILTNILF